MNAITIELCAEDRARLDQIIEKLGTVQFPNCSACARADAEAVSAPPVVAPPAVEDVTPQEMPALDAVADPAPVVGLAEFQKALTLRCAESDAMKAKVRELLNEYAPAASQVPDVKRAEVMTRLAEL